MSAPSVKRHEYDEHQDGELARWPGVTWGREVRSKHYALILTFGGVSRFVIYPMSPSDSWRGANHIRDIRHTLAAMGATRSHRDRSDPVQRPRRNQPAPDQRLTLGAQKTTRLGENPFAALTGLHIPPPRLSTGALFLRFFVRPQPDVIRTPHLGGYWAGDHP